MKKYILVTGGAGFIGSNLVQRLLEDVRVAKVRVLDNLSNGHYKNIEEYINHDKFEFVNGDIRDFNTCCKACEGMDLISHQAALGSVPRSIKDPLTTNDVNISGTLNIFRAAVESKIERVVFAASSSTYGDSKALPKVEINIGKPLSPYAITKYVNELYAEVFSKSYDFEYVGLRYFNVFGPKQDPHGAYAAVVPLFMKAAMNNESAVINGDGSFSRDFTYVQNAVDANMLSLFTTNKKATNEIYNVAYGERTTLNNLWNNIQIAANIKLNPQYGKVRPGDIPHSLADISKARELLKYNPRYDVELGLKEAYNWYQENPNWHE